MENLAHLQSWLRWVITHPNGVQPALNSSLNEPLPRAISAIADTPPLDRVSRLDIYAEGYFARLLEVLSDDFEHLQKALTACFDEGAFRKVISAYLVAHPSQTKTVCDVGQFLPTFLESYEPLIRYPYIAEIAHMDWCATRTLYIDSMPPFDPASLSDLTESDWVNLKFDLDPTVQFLSVQHSIDRVWNENQLEPDRIERRPTELLIFRLGEFVHVETIHAQQRQVLLRMREDRTLGEICEELETQATDESDLPPIMEWFGLWVSSGVIRSAQL